MCRYDRVDSTGISIGFRHALLEDLRLTITYTALDDDSLSSPNLKGVLIGKFRSIGDLLTQITKG